MSDTALPSRSGVTIRRAAQVDDSWGAFELSFDGNDSTMTLPPEAVRTVFLPPGSTRLELKRDGAVVFSQALELRADSKVEYLLGLVPTGWLGRLMGKGPKLHLSETARAYLAPYDPGPVQMITQQIWIGTADTKDALNDLMQERKAYYSEENEEAEGTDEHIALSGFTEAMGQVSYDHDFLEYGTAKPGDTLEERFKGHSWVEHWAPLVRDMMSAAELDAANAFIIMGVDDGPNRARYLQIKSPKDLSADGVVLRYLGEVTHPSH